MVQNRLKGVKTATNLNSIGKYVRGILSIIESWVPVNAI